jgi:UbiD family decarboxylase
VLENIRRGKDVDLLAFPTPRWFELDGGRYIGTGSVNITHDPEEGWTNLGTARVMIHDENTVGFYIAPGRHGRIHRDKAFLRGEPFKVAISVGHDPLIFLAGALEVPYGVCEYDFIGGIRGEPVEVIKGEFTRLPIPASAEIVLEGECVAGNERTEGPFGEWTGYYGSSARPEPIVKIHQVMYRNDHIILGYTRNGARRSRPRWCGTTWRPQACRTFVACGITKRAGALTCSWLSRSNNAIPAMPGKLGWWQRSVTPLLIWGVIRSSSMKISIPPTWMKFCGRFVRGPTR